MEFTRKYLVLDAPLSFSDAIAQLSEQMGLSDDEVLDSLSIVSLDLIAEDANDVVVYFFEPQGEGIDPNLLGIKIYPKGEEPSNSNLLLDANVLCVLDRDESGVGSGMGIAGIGRLDKKYCPVGRGTPQILEGTIYQEAASL